METETIHCRRTFSSVTQAVAYLRRAGYKPIAGTPREWKRVKDRQLHTARLSPRADSWLIEEYADEQ